MIPLPLIVRATKTLEETGIISTKGKCVFSFPSPEIGTYSGEVVDICLPSRERGRPAYSPPLSPTLPQDYGLSRFLGAPFSDTVVDICVPDPSWNYSPRPIHWQPLNTYYRRAAEIYLLQIQASDTGHVSHR